MQCDNSDMVKELIQNGADVNIKDKSGNNALTLYQGKDQGIIDALREAGVTGKAFIESQKEKKFNQEKDVVDSSVSEKTKKTKLLNINKYSKSY